MLVIVDLYKEVSKMTVICPYPVPCASIASGIYLPLRWKGVCAAHIFCASTAESADKKQ